MDPMCSLGRQDSLQHLGEYIWHWDSLLQVNRQWVCYQVYREVWLLLGLWEGRIGPRPWPSGVELIYRATQCPQLGAKIAAFPLGLQIVVSPTGSLGGGDCPWTPAKQCWMLVTCPLQGPQSGLNSGDLLLGVQKGMALSRYLGTWGWWQDCRQIGLKPSLQGNWAVSGTQQEPHSVSLLPGDVPILSKQSAIFLGYSGILQTLACISRLS